MCCSIHLEVHFVAPRMGTHPQSRGSTQRNWEQSNVDMYVNLPTALLERTYYIIWLEATRFDIILNISNFQLLPQAYFGAATDEHGNHLFTDAVELRLPTAAMNSTATFNALTDARFIRLVDDHVGSPPAKSDTPRNTITGTPGDVAVWSSELSAKFILLVSNIHGRDVRSASMTVWVRELSWADHHHRCALLVHCRHPKLLEKELPVFRVVEEHVSRRPLQPVDNPWSCR